MSEEAGLHFFDRDAEIGILERRLPHWSQPGVVTFITFRTEDSMPREVVEQWHAERAAWLAQHDIHVAATTAFADMLVQLPAKLAQEFRRCFSAKWHDGLDRCHGACVLKQPQIADIVDRSLLHFDGDRYDLTDFVVMPNHVHLLAAFRSEAEMTKQCESWKKYTATQINRQLEQRGRFWHPDAFDHLVRSERQFQYLRSYIADNPHRANLPSGACLHWSKRLNGFVQ